MTSDMTGLELSKLTVAASRRSEFLTYLFLSIALWARGRTNETLLPSDIRRWWN
jgi:hypothetical protein